MRNNIFKIVTIIFLLPLPLFAYLDPGSGSMLFSALIGIVATLFFVVKGFFFKIVNLPGYISGRKAASKETHKIVFYSEGPQYWNIFFPILRELNGRGVKCTYLSSKKSDPGLSTDMENIEPYYIGEGNRAFFFLNTLSADLCIMTTPGLDVLQIKRSKGVKKYIHIPHSTAGCSGYATYGLDYYDVVLPGGDADIKMVRELESVRNTERKEMEAIGCTYMDILRENVNSVEKPEFNPDGERKTILLSPTWGLHGLLRRFGDRILTYLTGLDKYNIIIRPHPQSFVSDKELMESLMQKYPETSTLKWDREPHGLKTMSQADVMISDFSGIIFDFIFLFERPVLAFKGEYDKRGHDSMDLSEDPWNIQAVEKTGISLEAEDIENLDEKIELFLKGNTSFAESLKDLHDGMDKYPGESGRRGADAILKVLESLS